MSPEERTATVVADRCAAHPNRPSVGTCDSCGNGLCVACAVPVRGGIVGVECVEQVLGTPPQPPVRPSRSLEGRLAGTGLVIAALASVFPWTRTGVGDGVFGGWDSVPSWSFAASALAVAVVVAWLGAGPSARRGAGTIAIGGGGLVLAAAAMAVIHPPFLTRPWLGPFVAIAGCLLAIGAAVADVRGPDRVR